MAGAVVTATCACPVPGAGPPGSVVQGGGKEGIVFDCGG